MSNTNKPTEEPVTFSTPFNNVFLPGLHPGVRTTANMKTSFPLTSEDMMFIGSVDANQHAAMEALNAVIEAAQNNYASACSRMDDARKNFFITFAKRHNIEASKIQSLRFNLGNGLVILEGKDQDGADLEEYFDKAISGKLDTAPPITPTTENKTEVTSTEPALPAEVVNFLKASPTLVPADADDEERKNIKKLASKVKDASKAGFLPKQVGELVELSSSIVDSMPKPDMVMSEQTPMDMKRMSKDMIDRMHLHDQESAHAFLSLLLDNSKGAADIKAKYSAPMALVLMTSAKGLIMVVSKDFPDVMLLKALNNKVDKKILVGFFTHYMKTPEHPLQSTQMDEHARKEAAATNEMLKCFLLDVLNIAMPD